MRLARKTRLRDWRRQSQASKRTVLIEDLQRYINENAVATFAVPHPGRHGDIGYEGGRQLCTWVRSLVEDMVREVVMNPHSSG